MVSLTDRASVELEKILTENNMRNAAFRVWVAGGGCSGLEYGMALDDNEPEADDSTFAHADLKIVVDSLSLSYLSGATVDYVDGPDGGGFRIDNPNLPAGGKCDGKGGCGGACHSHQHEGEGHEGGCCSGEPGCC